MNKPISYYHDPEQVRRAITERRHRLFVGGLWEEMGSLQLQYLIDSGLKPDQKLLDVGCGCLRGGVHFVNYLEPRNYFGTDLNQELLDAGYEEEIVPAGLAERLPRENLFTEANFDFSNVAARFDHALAFSLFTHLPLNTIRICLERLADVMVPGGIFHATFFEYEDGQPSWVTINQPPGVITTKGDSDPFHYKFSDFEHAAASLPWRVEYVGDISHPRGQRMLRFVRLDQAPSSRVNVSSKSASFEDIAKMPAGADHYRAYVGPTDRFDFMSATQFALLFQFGLREHHKVLDFGCGSLRLGRLLIPFLRAEGYYGIDPNSWLIDEGVKHELGQSAVDIKKPNFSHNEDFNCDVFGRKFDFIIAQSIITHTGPDMTGPLIASASAALDESGIFLFSYIRSKAERPQLPAAGWYYPDCVEYSDEYLMQALRDVGLIGMSLPWYHPGANWFAAAKNRDALPDSKYVDLATGAVLRGKQFVGSLRRQQ